MDTPDAPTQSLVQLFDDVARRHPQRIAVEVPPTPTRPQRQTTTYKELAQWADTLSSALTPVATQDAIVAVLLGRDTAALYAAQLAALKAGLAFTCLDHKFPDQHLRRILEDARPVALISDTEGLSRLRTLASNTLAIDVNAPPAGVQPD